MHQPISAAELSARLTAGERSFSRLTVLDDFVWDAANRAPLRIEGNLTLNEMHFKGQCHLGDLTVTGDLYLAGSTFDFRCALYRITAGALSAQQATFVRGLGIVNANIDIVDLLNARFPGHALAAPCGLLVKQSRGQLLRLDGVQSPSTVLTDADFASVTEHGADLGRRTPTTLGEIMAA